MCVLCLHVCLCTTFMSGALRVHRKASDPLERELQVVVNHHVSSGTRTWVLCKKSMLFITEPFLQPQHSVDLTLAMSICSALPSLLRHCTHCRVHRAVQDTVSKCPPSGAPLTRQQKDQLTTHTIPWVNLSTVSW